MSSNIYEINKYSNTWELVKMSRLVKRNRGTSLETNKQLVKIARHTKDNTKEITKETNTSKAVALQGEQVGILIKEFQTLNPMLTYGNITERNALEEMASKIGYDKLLATIRALPSIVSKPFAPKITKPTELRRDFGKLLVFVKQDKNKVVKYQAKSINI